MSSQTLLISSVFNAASCCALSLSNLTFCHPTGIYWASWLPDHETILYPNSFLVSIHHNFLLLWNFAYSFYMKQSKHAEQWMKKWHPERHGQGDRKQNYNGRIQTQSQRSHKNIESTYKWPRGLLPRAGSQEVRVWVSLCVCVCWCMHTDILGGP